MKIEFDTGNLSPRDAQWIAEIVRPMLPAPAPDGTVVRFPQPVPTAAPAPAPAATEEAKPKRGRRSKAQIEADEVAAAAAQAAAQAAALTAQTPVAQAPAAQAPAAQASSAGSLFGAPAPAPADAAGTGAPAERAYTVTEVVGMAQQYMTAGGPEQSAQREQDLLAIMNEAAPGKPNLTAMDATEATRFGNTLVARHGGQNA